MPEKYCEELNKKMAGKVEITQYAGIADIASPIVLTRGAVSLSTILFGRVTDKFNPFRVLMVGFTIGALSLAAFGLTARGSFLVIAVLSIVCGAFINGSDAGLLAVATTFYPVGIRASGIGWAYTVAKVGAMLAPALKGLLLLQNLTVFRIRAYQAFVGLFVAGGDRPGGEVEIPRRPVTERHHGPAVLITRAAGPFVHRHGKIVRCRPRHPRDFRDRRQPR
jgi:MFS family permease